MKIPTYLDLMAVWQKVMAKDGYYELLQGRGESITSIWAQSEHSSDSGTIHVGVTRTGLGQFITIKLSGTIDAVIQYDRETRLIGYGSIMPVVYPAKEGCPTDELVDLGVLFLILIKLHGIKCIESISYSENYLYVVHGDDMLSKFALENTSSPITKLSDYKKEI